MLLKLVLQYKCYCQQNSVIHVRVSLLCTTLFCVLVHSLSQHSVHKATPSHFNTGNNCKNEYAYV